MITYSIEQITPQRAAEYLEKNDRNRSVRPTQIEKYAQDMRAGRWCGQTAEPIKFNCDGTLLDGQHRLMACVKTGVTITATVARGVPHSAMTYMDAGEARDAGDVLSMRGHHNTHQLAAAASYLLDFKSGTIRKGGRPRVLVLDLVEKHRDLAVSVSRCCGIRCGASPSLLSAIHYLGTYGVSRVAETNEFVEVLASGVPRHGPNDPAFVWRERMIRSRVSNSMNMALTRDAVVRGTVHAYNLFIGGVRVKKFPIPDKNPGIDGLDREFI